MNFRCEL